MSKKNVYQTNQGGVIKAPSNPAPNEPKSTKVTSDGDLRIKKG